MIRYDRGKKLLALLACVLGLLLLPLSGVQAQDAVAVEFGTSTTGTLPSDGAQAPFTFNGNPGDLVTARVVGLTQGMDPNLTLLGPAQETLATNENTPLLPATTDAEIVFRLLTAGTHTLVVSGTTGDFLLTVQVRPQVVSTVLVFDTPTVAVLPLDPANQVFVFNTDPFQATTLLIDAEPFTLNAFIEVRNSTGQVVAILGGNLDNACLSLGPGDDFNEVSVRGAPEAVGDISFTLSNTPCAFSPEPVVFDVRAIPFEPVPIPDVCAVSSFFNVNVRSGPGLNFPVIMLLLARTPLQVIGVSEDGNWYAVQLTNFQGWVAASVTFLSGPCDALPVVPAPEPPAQPPTPGFIIVTGTPGPTQTPVVITGTPGPTQTPVVVTNTPAPGEPTVAPTDVVETPAGGPTATTAPAASPTPAEPTAEPTTGEPTTVPLTLEPTTTG